MREDRADFTTMSLACLERVWADAKHDEHSERTDDDAAAAEQRVRENKRKINAH